MITLLRAETIWKVAKGAWIDMPISRLVAINKTKHTHATAIHILPPLTTKNTSGGKTVIMSERFTPTNSEDKK